MANAGSEPELRRLVDELRAEVADLRRSRRRLVEAEIAHRQAVERELHDGLQQQLVALAVDIQRVGGLSDRDARAAKALLESVAANLREAVRDAAALAQKIYPPLLDGHGLASSLRSLAASQGVTVAIDVATPALPPEISAAIYWICGEALGFAAPGSDVTIHLRHADAGATFEVELAGRPPATLVERLQDRVEVFDGRLTIEADEPGCRIQGWLPLPA